MKTMMGKRLAGVIAGLSLICCGAGAASAAADGVQLGPTLLFPALTVSATHDSNVGLSAANEESDWVTTVAPSLRLLVPVRRFYLEADGGLEFVTYSDLEDEDATNWHAGGAVGADFPGGLAFKLSDRYEERYLVTSQEFGPGEDLAVNALKGLVSFAIRDAFRVEVGGGRTDYAYDRSTSRERAENAAQVDLYWKFKPRTSAVVGFGWTDYAYDSNEAQDNQATQVTAGLTWDVTARSTGYAKAGYQWKRYDTEDPARGTEDGDYFTAAIGARNQFTSRTALEVEISRASRESDFVANPYYLRTALSAGLAHRFTAKIYGRATARYAYDDYPNAATYDNPYDGVVAFESGDRTDKTLAGTLTIGFDVLRWLALEAALGAETRDSSFDAFDYDATRVTLSAKAAF